MTHPFSSPALEKQSGIFFLGIGGVSMSSLAMLAQAQGLRVGGCDRSPNAYTKFLTQQGVCVQTEEGCPNLSSYQRVVYTLAVPPTHPILQQAKELGIPCESRAEYLGRMMQSYPVRIGVAGSHGKSTVTAMLSRIFLCAQKDPCVLCGARIPSLGGRAYRVGGEKTLLFEACEYRDAFLSFSPTTALLLNLEYDHVDYFTTFSQLKNSFAQYARSANEVVFCAEDENLMSLSRKEGQPWISYALHGEADYTARDCDTDGSRARFTLCAKKRPIAVVHLQVGGMHTIQNALAASATALSHGIALGSVVAGLQTFSGIERRMERLGTFEQTVVYSDYAHHPTELSATLAQARLLAQQRKGHLLALFQSHTYSRSQAFLEEFAKALSVADRLWILPIFGAREATEGTACEQKLATLAHGTFVSDFSCALQAINKEKRPQDLLLLLGAGDVDSLRTKIVWDKKEIF